MTAPMELQVLGHLTLLRDKVVMPMISSRKTRSLLAYLAITDQAHPREHLCEVFFDNTSDPRGALRWSLSRIRNMIDTDAASHLIVDKDTVQLDLRHISLDLGFVHDVNDDPAPAPADLIKCAEMLTHRPLTHLHLPRSEDFDDWLSRENEILQDLRGQIVQKIAAAPSVSDAEALRWLRSWVRQDPKSRVASQALWQRLIDLQYLDEADEVALAFQSKTGSRRGLEQPQPLDQKIGFCETQDGVRIALASVGAGPALVKAANWLNHLERDWQSPIWAETFQALSKQNTLVRYDERGNGLSDWDVPEISFSAFVDDLETVVDELQLDRFPLLGMSQGCAVSIAYAVRHPHRVSSLILIGGYAAGWRVGMTPEEIEQREAVLTLTRHGWGTSNPAYRHIFSQTFMPDADADRLAWFDEFQRKTTSPENAVRFQEAFGDIDVRHLLGQVKAPTLVLHAKGDQRIPLAHGQALADAIPNATMVALDSRNHIILGDEPAWQVCMDEIQSFLRRHSNI